MGERAKRKGSRASQSACAVVGAEGVVFACGPCLHGGKGKGEGGGRVSLRAAHSGGVEGVSVDEGGAGDDCEFAAEDGGGVGVYC